MDKIFFCYLTLWIHTATAAIYSSHEIQQILTETETQIVTEQFISDYFQAAKPNAVVDQFINSQVDDVVKEYALGVLLDTIRTEAPQKFHRELVSKLKTRPAQVMQMHPEGPFQAPVFNLSSRAEGVENLWLAQTTEALFVDWFRHSPKQALVALEQAGDNPKWPGVKNAFARLSASEQRNLAATLLQQNTQTLTMGRLLAHVALRTQDPELIERALNSPHQGVRQHTLRHLPQWLPSPESKRWLFEAAQNGPDQAFATSLLTPYQGDLTISTWLRQQLKTQTLGSQAAFVLSQTQDVSVIKALQVQHQKSNNPQEQQRIVMALKLNPAPAAQLLLSKLNASSQQPWLNSFDDGVEK